MALPRNVALNRQDPAILGSPELGYASLGQFREFEWQMSGQYYAGIATRTWNGLGQGTHTIPVGVHRDKPSEFGPYVIAEQFKEDNELNEIVLNLDTVDQMLITGDYSRLQGAGEVSAKFLRNFIKQRRTVLATLARLESETTGYGDLIPKS